LIVDAHVVYGDAERINVGVHHHSIVTILCLRLRQVTVLDLLFPFSNTLIRL
jgi:hypothetical protein